MQSKHVAIVLVLGVGAATGAGVWVMQGGEPETVPVKPTLSTPTALLPEPAPEVRPAPDLENWTPSNAPIVIAEAEPAPREDEQARRDRQRAEFMQRYDTNGDGKLSEEEREAARQAFQARGSSDRQLLMRRFDADGDGQLNETERENARAEIRRVREQISAKIVPQYDLDGNGELDNEERQAAAPAYRAEIERIRTIATLDVDGSGQVEEDELALALLGVTDGDQAMDLNRDGEVDYRDAAYASEVAKSND